MIAGAGAAASEDDDAFILMGIGVGLFGTFWWVFASFFILIWDTPQRHDARNSPW